MGKTVTKAGLLESLYKHSLLPTVFKYLSSQEPAASKKFFLEGSQVSWLIIGVTLFEKQDMDASQNPEHSKCVVFLKKSWAQSWVFW